MKKADVWTTVHTERKALAGDLEGLNDVQWTASSWCDGWSIRDVVAHMTGTAKITPPTFFPRLLASGMSLGRLQAKDIEREKGTSPGDTLARFESVTTSVKHPPGPIDTILGETIIHAEDIRRPLAISHQYPIDAVEQVLNFYKGSNLIIGAKRRIAGLRFVSNDSDWSHGTGPEVQGPAVALLLAMTGRKEVLGDLSGDGLATLRERS
jgi:uncharacterized protein (TIGR03083 family)